MGTIIALLLSFTTITITPRIAVVNPSATTVSTDTNDNNVGGKTCNIATDDVMGG